MCCHEIDGRNRLGDQLLILCKKNSIDKIGDPVKCDLSVHACYIFSIDHRWLDGTEVTESHMDFIARKKNANNERTMLFALMMSIEPTFMKLCSHHKLAQ